MIEDIGARYNIPRKTIKKLVDDELKKIAMDLIYPGIKILTNEITVNTQNQPSLRIVYFCTKN